MTESNEFLRPSLLPKLAVCGHYRSSGEETESTKRGTKLDTALRALLQKKNISTGDFTREEIRALQWAEKTALALAGKFAIQSDEEYLKIDGWGDHGTADVLCEDALWSGDLKSGQKRNYAEQMAAYAIGFMDRYFVEEWTCYLFYCDLEEVETLRFTREEAERLVRNAIANSNDPKPPTPNEYCGWCAKRWECPARREQLAILPFSVNVDGIKDFEESGSPLLREFVLRANTVADFAEKARDILKERAVKGEKIPGVSLISKRGVRKVPERVIEVNLLKLGVGDVLAAYGPMPEAKLKEIWSRQLPDKPFPENEVIEVPGSTYIRVSQPKLKN